jgi:hypothetical protein
VQQRDTFCVLLHHIAGSTVLDLLFVADIFSGSATQPPFCNFKLGENGDSLYDQYPGQ